MELSEIKHVNVQGVAPDWADSDEPIELQVCIDDLARVVLK